MKRQLLAIVFFSIFSLNFFSFIAVGAEGEGGTDIPTDTDIDVVLSTDNQDPGSKEFDLVATITSKLDSGRVLVDWRLPSQIALAMEGDTATSRTTLKAGETKVVTKRVRSRFQGKYTIEVKVTAIKADVNYITADKKVFEFNEALELLPMTEEYKQAKLFRTIRIVLIGAFVVITVTVGGYYGYRKLRMWVNTPG